MVAQVRARVSFPCHFKFPCAVPYAHLALFCALLRLLGPALWLVMVAQVRARVSLARRAPARSLTFTSLSSVPFYVSSGPRGGWLAMATQLSRSKPHILAVAPSNVAVDNMIQRIMDKVAPWTTCFLPRPPL